MSKKLVSTGFDYSQLDSVTAGRLQYYANSGRTLVRRNMIRFIAEFGEVLSESRKLLSKHGDGTFCKWATSEFDLSRQTVYNYVNSWERCLSNGWTNFDHLSPTALYLMCHDDTPKPVRDKVLQLAKKQPAITKSDVDALLDRGGPKRTTKPPTMPERAPESPPDFDPFEAANQEIGEDGRTDSDGTDAQEPAQRQPRKGKERPLGVDYFGKCPNCLGIKWEEDEDGVSCSKCHHPHGEPVGDVDEDRLNAQRPPRKDKLGGPPKQYDRSFWFRQWEQSIGPLVRLVDKIAEGVGERCDPHQEAIHAALETATEEMSQWMHQ